MPIYLICLTSWLGASTRVSSWKKAAASKWPRKEASAVGSVRPSPPTSDAACGGHSQVSTCINVYHCVDHVCCHAPKKVNMIHSLHSRDWEVASNFLCKSFCTCIFQQSSRGQWTCLIITPQHACNRHPQERADVPCFRYTRTSTRYAFRDTSQTAPKSLNLGHFNQIGSN
jgi:hypothetical protein